MEKKRITIIAKEEDIRSLDNSIDYKKRQTVMDDYINIIFKMALVMGLFIITSLLL